MAVLLFFLALPAVIGIAALLLIAFFQLED